MEDREKTIADLVDGDEALDYTGDGMDDGYAHDLETGSEAAANPDGPPSSQEPQGREQAPAVHDDKSSNAAAAPRADAPVPSSSAMDTDDVMAQPPHGTEIHMSRVPRDATEAQVREMFARAGEVYQVRVPKDPGHPAQNKGFAFGVYVTKAAADQALQTLGSQDFPGYPGRKVVVARSEAKNRLFLGNVPRDMSQAVVTATLETLVKGLINLEIVTDKDTGSSRGFGFAEFYNHAAAEAARRVLTRADFRLGGRELTVMWAEPKRSDAAAETVRAVYVSGLPDRDLDEGALKELFAPYGEVTHIVALKELWDANKLRGYGFVHFAERAQALKAVAAAEGGHTFELAGRPLRIELAKPPATTRESHDEAGPPGRYGPPPRGGHGGPPPYAAGPPPPARGGSYWAGPPARGAGPPPPARGRPSYSSGPPAPYADYDAFDPYEPYGGGYTMMPMVLPNGQMAYGVVGGPPPPAARGGAPAPYPMGGRGGPPPAARGYGYADDPRGYGGPASRRPPPRSPPGGGAGGGGYVPRGYAGGAGRYAPY